MQNAAGSPFGLPAALTLVGNNKLAQLFDGSGRIARLRRFLAAWFDW